MTKTFNVAGHLFSLTLPDDLNIWDSLGNYDPFEVPSVETLFDVTVVESLEYKDLKLVYSQCDKDEPDMSRIDLFRYEDGWVMDLYVTTQSPISARLQCDLSFSHGRLMLLDNTRHMMTYGINNSLMLMYAFRTSCLCTLEMHASVTVKDGKGYLFLGKSGTGKSTHSRQWLENIKDTWLLNDDNPVVRTFPDGSVKVYGSPWSGKTPCYKNEVVEVGSVVLIRQCPENKIIQMTLPEAYATIYSSASGFKVDESMADGFHDTISSFVVNVPCFVLDCRPDGDAARVCYAAVRK